MVRSPGDRTVEVLSRCLSGRYSPHMERIGDERAGFSVGFDPATSTVHVRAWGFWGVEVATAFDSEVSNGCRGLPRGSTMFMDMSELKPMRDEGQLSFRRLIGELPRLGIKDTTIRTDNQLTKLQLLRLAGTVAAGELIRFT